MEAGDGIPGRWWPELLDPAEEIFIRFLSINKCRADLHCEAALSRQGSREGLSGLRTSEFSPPPSPLLGLAELAMENTPESAWEAGESLLLVSRGDSGNYKKYIKAFTKLNKTIFTFSVN